MATETLNPNTRSTGNVNTDMHVRDVASRIAWLEPRANPLTALTLAAGKKRRRVTNPQYEWIEQRRITDVTQVAVQAAASAAATTITLDDGTIAIVGDVLSNLTSGENARCVSRVGNVWTVVREIGGSAVTWSVNDYVMVIAPAFEENSDNPDVLSREAELVWNYIQTQRHNFSMSEIQRLTRQYGDMTDWQVRNRENVIKDAVAREKTAWWGLRDIEAGSTFPRRYTSGVFWFLDQAGSGAAVRPAIGTLTLATIDLWAEDLFQYDPSDKMVFCGRRALTAFTQCARGGADLPRAPEDKVFGLGIREFVTAHGRLLLTPHQLFGQNAQTTGLAVGLTMKNVGMAFMGEQFTQVMRNVQPNGRHGREDGLVTNWGIEVRLPETHGYLSGITGGT